MEISPTNMYLAFGALSGVIVYLFKRYDSKQEKYEKRQQAEIDRLTNLVGILREDVDECNRDREQLNQRLDVLDGGKNDVSG